MAEVVGIRFKEVGKVYYFDPDSMKFKKGDKAIVETARGVECGEVAMENREVPEEEIVKPLAHHSRRDRSGLENRSGKPRKREKSV